MKVLIKSENEQRGCDEEKNHKERERKREKERKKEYLSCTEAVSLPKEHTGVRAFLLLCSVIIRVKRKF